MEASKNYSFAPLNEAITQRNAPRIIAEMDKYLSLYQTQIDSDDILMIVGVTKVLLDLNKPEKASVYGFIAYNQIGKFESPIPLVYHNYITAALLCVYLAKAELIQYQSSKDPNHWKNGCVCFKFADGNIKDGLEEDPKLMEHFQWQRDFADPYLELCEMMKAMLKDRSSKRADALAKTPVENWIALLFKMMKGEEERVYYLFFQASLRNGAESFMLDVSHSYIFGEEHYAKLAGMLSNLMELETEQLPKGDWGEYIADKLEPSPSLLSKGITQFEGDSDELLCAAFGCHLYNILTRDKRPNAKVINQAARRLADRAIQKKNFSSPKLAELAIKLRGVSNDNDGSTGGRYRPTKASQQSKSGGCFIATACYGSYDSPEVKVLREFRDRQLMTTVFGKVAVRVYYKISPFFAGLLKSRPKASYMIKRYFLSPLVRWLERYN